MANTHTHTLTQINTEMQIDTKKTHTLALAHAERGMSTAVTSCFLALETPQQTFAGVPRETGGGGERGVCVVAGLCVGHTEYIKSHFCEGARPACAVHGCTMNTCTF